MKTVQSRTKSDNTHNIQDTRHPTTNKPRIILQLCLRLCKLCPYAQELPNMEYASICTMPQIMQNYAKNYDLCQIMLNYAQSRPFYALGKCTPNISHGHAMLKIFIFELYQHSQFQSSSNSTIMATFIPHYDATFLIRRSPTTPDLAVVTAVRHSLNISTGSFIVLRTSSNPNHITFGAQVGWLLGFCGRFAIIKLFRSGLPGLRYLMIAASWLQLDRLEWDLWYYEVMGGLPTGDMFYVLTLTPLRWVLENGEWRTTYGEGI